VNELFEDYQTNLSGILLSFWAGSSTGFGAIFAVVFMDYCSKREPRGIHAALAFSLSLAAGVMVTVSLVDLWYPLVIKFGFFIPSLCTALGFLFFHLLQLGLKTHCEAPSGNLSPLPLSAKAGVSSSLKDRNMKLAITMFFTLTLHNFPEGLAVQVSNLSSESLGFTMAIAIAFHNFPEGIAIACPYYAATGHRGRAIGLAFLSGMSEPMGAGFSVLVLQSFFRENVNLISYALCVVGGIMLSSSLFELLPESVSHGRNDLVVVGFVIGSLIMLFTIWAIE
jgi:ZIP family zinc transporter